MIPHVRGASGRSQRGLSVLVVAEDKEKTQV